MQLWPVIFLTHSVCLSHFRCGSESQKTRAERNIYVVFAPLLPLLFVSAGNDVKTRSRIFLFLRWIINRVYVCVCVCMCVSLCVCIYIYTHTHTHTHTPQIYIHTDKHTHIHTKHRNITSLERRWR